MWHIFNNALLNILNYIIRNYYIISYDYNNHVNNIIIIIYYINNKQMMIYDIYYI